MACSFFARCDTTTVPCDLTRYQKYSCRRHPPLGHHFAKLESAPDCRYDPRYAIPGRGDFKEAAMSDAQLPVGTADSAVAAESRRPKSSSSRRSFLVGLAATGAIAAFSTRSAALQGGPTASKKAFRIDTHHHFTTPKLFALSTAKGVNQPTLKDWTPEKSLEE